jgi:two-component system sensor histidine kinase DesK
MANTAPIPRQKRRDWTWFWFGYTGFLFIQPLLEPSRALWFSTLAVFAAYLGICVAYTRTGCNPRARLWMIVATFALGLASFPWNQGAMTFFIYAAAFLPFAFASVRRVFVLFVLECAVILAEGFLFDHYFAHGPFHIGAPNMYIAIFLVLTIGGGNIFNAEQVRADKKLLAAQQENFALAAVAERERIARDLHDVLGHTLSVVVLKAELAGRLIHRDDPSDLARAATEIADVERITRTALAEVREAIGGYRTRGLRAEMEAARLTLDAAGVTLILDAAATSTANLTAPEEIALSLALREAITNIVRHSRATTCSLRFVTEANQRRFVIEDNGEHAITREGNGLRGMRERIESLGGHLFLECGNGTRLLIELPLREPAAS